jgi:hypothetical protein
VALGLAAMRTAMAIFRHAETIRVLTTEYGNLSERFRTTFTTTRELFDSGEAALKLLEFDNASSERPLPLRREATTTRVDDDETYTVRWRVCSPGELPDETTASLSLFETMTSLLDSLYRSQLDTRRRVTWANHTIKIADGPFRLEQLARATLDGVAEVLGHATMQMHEVPVVAVAAGIDEPVGHHRLDALREELRKRADEWRQKRGLLRRRRPLQGRTIFIE